MHVAVIGAGLMGHGLAQVFAAKAERVTVYDPEPKSLATLRARVSANLDALGEDNTIVEHVVPVDTIAAAVRDADYVVEAAVENLGLKQKLFVEIENAARPGAILASNTSVIPITEIMRGLQDRSRGIGTHWWNPPYLVPLVEVIPTEWTDPAVVERVLALHRDLGKTAVLCKKDVPGFIGNRLQHALWREAVSLVETGICDAETVDTVVKSSFGLRSAVLGPLENADLVGTDLTLAIHELLLPALESRPGPSPYLEALVADGKLGMKSGEGFQRWTAEAQAAVRARLTAHLLAARKIKPV